MPRDDDAEIYEKHAEELVGFATGLVGPSDAADVVSEAVLRCLRSRAWPTVREPRAYLYRAVLSEARQHHRTTMRRRAREARAASVDSVQAVDVDPTILDAVSGLSIRQRAVIVLAYWQDLTPGEIATMLGIGEGSVRRHLARARARLREVLHGD